MLISRNCFQQEFLASASEEVWERQGAAHVSPQDLKGYVYLHRIFNESMSTFITLRYSFMIVCTMSLLVCCCWMTNFLFFMLPALGSFSFPQNYFDFLFSSRFWFCDWDLSYSYHHLCTQYPFPYNPYPLLPAPKRVPIVADYDVGDPKRKTKERR